MCGSLHKQLGFRQKRSEEVWIHVFCRDTAHYWFHFCFISLSKAHGTVIQSNVATTFEYTQIKIRIHQLYPIVLISIFNFRIWKVKLVNRNVRKYFLSIWNWAEWTDRVKRGTWLHTWRQNLDLPAESIRQKTSKWNQDLHCLFSDCVLWGTFILLNNKRICFYIFAKHLQNPAPLNN